MFRQAITVRYYPPTNHRPSRLKISASAGTRWEQWDRLEGHASDDARYIAAAKAYAASKLWAGAWNGGVVANGDYVFVLCDMPNGTNAFCVPVMR